MSQFPLGSSSQLNKSQGIENSKEIDGSFNSSLVKRGSSSNLNSPVEKQEIQKESVGQITDESLKSDENSISSGTVNPKKVDLVLSNISNDLGIKLEPKVPVKQNKIEEQEDQEVELEEKNIDQPKQVIPNLPTYTPKPEDISLLRNTKDNAKVNQTIDNGKVVHDLLKPGLDKLIKELDGSVFASSKNKVYPKAELLASNIIKNNSSNGAIMSLQMKSDDEIKDFATQVVFSSKEKYNSPEYKIAKQNFDSKIQDFNELTRLKKGINDWTYGNATEEQKSKRAEFVEQYMNKIKEVNPDFFKTLDPSSKFVPNVNQVMSKPVEPKMIDYLPPNKKLLVDSITNGLLSELKNNKVSDKFTLGELSEKDRNKITKGIILKKDFNIESVKQSIIFAKQLKNENIDPIEVNAEAERRQKEMLDQVSITVPKNINLNGKKYDFESVLAAGGDGIAYLMKPSDGIGEKVVAKASIVDVSLEDSMSSFKKELAPHIGVMGDGNNPNILNLKGIVKNGDELISITELAKGGEMNDVTDKINEAKSKNLVSPKNEELLKKFMIKDALTGLAHMHTEKNMTHYDIKPKNFFVGQNGQVKLADFGRSQFGRLSPEGQMTTSYLPPEGSRLDNKQFSEKTDVFAMGLTIAETFKGDNPFVTRNQEYISGQKLMTGESDLDSIINAMTNQDPSKRTNLTSVVKHSFFNDKNMSNPEVKTKVGQLMEAIMSGDENKISQLDSDLTQILK